MPVCSALFQPTRPLRGATTSIRYLEPELEISTHAPLAGRDSDRGREEQLRMISTHAPLAGRDEMRRVNEDSLKTFQPTRPLRGATSQRITAIIKAADFNPRAPCGARLILHGATPPKHPFQPTRPLRGATARADRLKETAYGFQPTRPLRGATVAGVTQHIYIKFQPTRPLRGATETAGLLFQGY